MLGVLSDLGHNEEKKIFFSITRCFEGVPPPPKVWYFWTREKFFDKCDISLTKRERVMFGTKIYRLVNFLSVVNTFFIACSNRNEVIYEKLF